MIERLFLRQVYRELEEDRDGIHVSDLVTLNICPRLFWFDKNQPLPPDVDHALKLWQGKKLHEIVLGDLHEYEIEYEGIKGRIDDYISDLGILIDKKFVGYLPKDDKDVEKYYDHYILQLKLYSYMLPCSAIPLKRLSYSSSRSAKTTHSENTSSSQTSKNARKYSYLSRREPRKSLRWIGLQRSPKTSTHSITPAPIAGIAQDAMLRMRG